MIHALKFYRESERDYEINSIDRRIECVAAILDITGISARASINRAVLKGVHEYGNCRI